MKISTATFFAVLSVLGAIMIVSSCSRTERFAGLWAGTPSRLYNVEGASDATSTVTIDFAPSTDVRQGGSVVLSATVEVSQAVTGSTLSPQMPYQANVAATASIQGRYMAEGDDDNDLILHLDAPTLKVNVDPAGVTFSDDILTGLERPVLDSLTRATADSWRVILTSVMRDELYKYQKIDDIKVHHADIMSCEVGGRDYTFRRIAPN